MRYRYTYPANINSFDVQLLLKEMQEAKLPVLAVHKGNGMLLFEFSKPLEKTDKTTLATIIKDHKVLLYEGFAVKSAEDVDRITQMKIAKRMGGLSPQQRQLGILTKILVNLLQSINSASNLADVKADINAILNQIKDFYQDREQYINDAATFKSLNNLT